VLVNERAEVEEAEDESALEQRLRRLKDLDPGDMLREAIKLFEAQSNLQAHKLLLQSQDSERKLANQASALAEQSESHRLAAQARLSEQKVTLELQASEQRAALELQAQVAVDKSCAEGHG
jgi:hypothetical protein